VTSDIGGTGASESKPYLVGPMAEVRLPWHFAFEADALYSRFGFSSTTSDFLSEIATQRGRANSWQFPLLAKYRLRIFRVRPYALLGYVPRHGSGKIDYAGRSSTTLSSSGPFVPYAFSDALEISDHAWVAGGGVQLRAGPFRITPEVRYLRWNDSPYSFNSHGYYLVVPQNEMQVLLGIGWGGK